MVSSPLRGGRLVGVVAAAVGCTVALSSGQLDAGTPQSTTPIDFLVSTAIASPPLFIAILATVAGVLVAVGPWGQP
ncbi:hypothetical protein ACH9L7_01810 [Haloferax sp. S1W]|uniref:hypothetical protein n=1 Tax=Haloferax sp. S1W TaxID=3377110 RepID=UPI0037CA82DF